MYTSMCIVYVMCMCYHLTTPLDCSSNVHSHIWTMCILYIQCGHYGRVYWLLLSRSCMTICGWIFKVSILRLSISKNYKLIRTSVQRVSSSMCVSLLEIKINLMIHLDIFTVERQSCTSLCTWLTFVFTSTRVHMSLHMDTIDHFEFLVDIKSSS